MEIAAQLNRHGEAPDGTAAKRVVGRPFTKGASGNAKGRPRKAVTAADARRITRASIHEMVRAAAFAPVQVEIDGELAEITALEAGLRQVAMQAAGGDRLALLALTRLLASTTGAAAAEGSAREDGAETEIETDEPRVDPEFALAATYKQGWSEVLDFCRRGKEPVPEPVPHPDTIQLDEATGTVRFTEQPPPEGLSLDPLAAFYRELHDGVRNRLEELHLPTDLRPAQTRRWYEGSLLLDQLYQLVPEQHRLPPLMPSTLEMDWVEGLEEGSRRCDLFMFGHPEVRAAAAMAAPAATTEAAPEPEEAPDPAPPPSPADEEATACRDICARALAAAGGASHWVRPPLPDQAATGAGLRNWLAALNDAWDQIEYAWASTGLIDHRRKLEAQQKRVAQARAIVEQGLAAWEARQAASGRDDAVAAADDPPDEDSPGPDEARAYVRICTEALELATGACLNVQAPKPSPHLVVIGSDGGVGWHGDTGPGDGPTMANLRRWPARLAAVAAELDAAIGRTTCPGELVRLRSGRRIVERMQEIVEDGVAEWEVRCPDAAGRGEPAPPEMADQADLPASPS